MSASWTRKGRATRSILDLGRGGSFFISKHRTSHLEWADGDQFCAKTDPDLNPTGTKHPDEPAASVCARWDAGGQYGHTPVPADEREDRELGVSLGRESSGQNMGRRAEPDGAA